MKTLVLASLFCMDNILPILIGLLGAALLGWLLHKFMGGGSNNWEEKYNRLAADFHEERNRNNKLHNEQKKKKSNDAQVMATAAVKDNSAELAQLNNKVKSYKQQIKSLEDQNALLNGDINKAKSQAAQATTLNSEVETLKARIEGINRALETSKTEAEKYKGDFESANSERTRLNAQLNNSDVGALKKQIDKLEQDLDASRMTVASLQAQNNKFASGAKSVDTGHATELPVDNTPELKAKIESQQADIVSLKQNNAKLQKENESTKLAINAAVNEANSKSNMEIADLKRKLKQADADLTRTLTENTRLAAQVGNTQVNITQAPAIEVAAPAASVQEAAPAVASPIAEPQDLTVIEGIGPKIAELLTNEGITNYIQLANVSVATLQHILDAAGPAYTVHQPDTWPVQSALLRDGKLDEFKALCNELKGGRAE
jgi:predicted flap endonuclease-1-like 5' DNA nuclease/outer membrane murein-binding lipoprotein Lpp